MNTYKQKKILFEILKYLQSKENENKLGRIWVHREFDGNQTNFEYQSNNDLIGFQTTLRGKDVGLLMHIFQALFDVNMCSFDEFLELPESKTLKGKDLYKLCLKTLDITSEGENEKIDNVPMVYSYKLLNALF